MKKSLALLLAVAATLSASPVFAEGAAAVAEAAATGGKDSSRVWVVVAIAVSSAFGMAIAAVGTGLAQSNAIRGAVEGIARNPSASSKIFTTMLIGIAMIESLAIYALVIGLILLFVWNPISLL
ncbi:MAG: ATP synthase F0 subunit C [Deltaproteobacteria bacterium RIFCSPLOWO2_02_FULL_53_8]|nr:MAG: ATP synthase F0 subunit C [Deltaproteobacteria bacterium RIFCSPLOWO2_02_FULL_53_8]